MLSYLILFFVVTAIANGAIDEPFDCPEMFGLYPVEGSCRHFYQCAFGQAHIKLCPHDLHFNEEKQTCDYAVNANCRWAPTTVRPPTTVAPPTPVPTPLPTPVPTSPPTLPPAFKCPEPNGVYASPVSCREFYVCLKNVAYKTVCEPGFLFNPESEACDYEANVDCSLDPPTVGPPTVAPTTTPAPITPSTLPPTPPPPFDCPQPDGIFPSPHSCQHFYNCIDNIAYLNICESDFLFNPDQGFCDYPHNVVCH